MGKRHRGNCWAGSRLDQQLGEIQLQDEFGRESQWVQADGCVRYRRHSRSFYPYYNEVQTDWRYNKETFREFWSQCKPPPIEPIKTLYNELVAVGIPIVLISGREATLKEET